MRRAPGATTLVIATLAIGVGANVTLVGAINLLLLRPPEHIREPERVVRLLAMIPNENGEFTASSAAHYPRLLDLEREATAFEAVAGVSSRRLSLGVGAEAVDVRAGLVSANFFGLLGALPDVGRTFSAADGFPTGTTTGGPPLAVLSHRFWLRRFGGDPGVVNRAMHIGAFVYTIVGVMPDGFRGLKSESPDLWLPITVASSDPNVQISLSNGGMYSLSIIGRLHPSATRALAEAQAAEIWQRDELRVRADGAPIRIVAASLIRGRGPDAPREVMVTVWLSGVSVLVLLITCANVANLLLGRAIARRHEIAVRLALGAGRGRLARQLLAEGMMLAVPGGGMALALAAVMGPLLSSLLMGDAAGHFLDPGLFLFAAAVALGTGLLISLAPMIQAVKGTRPTDLRVGGASASRAASHARAGLLVTQSALCMTMLVWAGLFALSLQRVSGLDLGLDAAHTLRARVDLDGLLLPNDAVDATYDEMLERVRSIPGVIDAALADGDPHFEGRAVDAHTSERELPRGAVPMESAVGDGYFRAVGATTLRGRDFERTDDRGSARVAIINEPLARLLFPGEDALGECIMLPDRAGDRGGPCVTIVGVLSGVWYMSLLDRDRPLVYVPIAQVRGRNSVWRPHGIFIRVSGPATAIVEPVRRALQSVRAGLPAVQVTLLQDELEAQTRPWRLGATLFGVFGAVAVVVAVVGLYGVVAFAVTQRSFEIAVRLALGARRHDILRTVSGDGLGAVALGLVIGAIAAVSVRRWIGPLLFQTSADDPRIILGIAILLFSVAFLAILLPTARAIRLDAAAILRAS